MAAAVGRYSGKQPRRGANLPFRRLVARIAGLCLLLPGALLFAQPRASEDEVKAAFLYNFATYVEWPAESLADDQPVVFGVAGDDEVAGFLEALARERLIRDRPFVVRRLGPGASMEGLHVLFVDGEHRDRQALLDATTTAPVLTVTEAERDHPSGSTINFKLDQGRVRFDISLPAARSKGLGISSRLLAIAKQIIGQTPHMILLFSLSGDS